MLLLLYVMLPPFWPSDDEEEKEEKLAKPNAHEKALCVCPYLLNSIYYTIII